MKAQHIAPKPFRIAIARFIAMVCLIGSAFAQTINNPSFELDTFTVYPGYTSLNGPITGWTGAPADRVGINPAGGTPFADNGTIPNGANVAFIQSFAGGSATLSTEITGLTPGEKYAVNFRLNARGTQVPFLKVGIDGKPIGNLSTTGVGGTAAYRYASFHFIAEGASAMLWLTNDVSGDTTVLVDDFSIAPYSTTLGWSFDRWTNDADSGVDGSRNYTHAFNFGNSAANAPDTTINGVLFKGIAGGSPSSVDFWTQGPGSSTTDTSVNVTGNGANLAKSFIYGGNPGYYCIGGLVPGMEYIATFYALAWEDGARAQTFTYGNDRLTVNQDHYGNNNGIRISYRYIAPPGGAITLLQIPTLPASSLHLYAFANCEVAPETQPVIGIQPQDQIMTLGATAVFKVTAGGARPLFYQWYNNGILLTDQTNRVLVVSNLTSADVGPYYVEVSNANGTATSDNATITFGTIANPSFEAEVFHAWPGYINGNSLISGWTASDPARVGINPEPPAYPGPFANNGAVPDGRNVALIQYASGSGTTLSTMLNNLTPGENYVLKFRANARDYNSTRPTLRVAIDGQLIGEMRLAPVGGSDPYRYAAFSFIPQSETASLTLTNDTTDSALVDDFSVVPFTTKWSFAPWNNDASSGVDPLSRYSHAYNLGGIGLAKETIINGVRFTGVYGPNPSALGHFSTMNLSGAYAPADSNSVITAGGGSATMAESFVYYAGTIPGDQMQTITISNLIPGVEYQADIYGIGFDQTNAAGKSYARSATFIAGDDSQTINEDQFGLDSGVRVSYRYVADESGTLQIRYQPTDRYSSFHTYGFSNQELNSSNPPHFYRQPFPRMVSAGSSVVLDALVGGQSPVFLQWQKDGIDLPEQTNSVLTLAGVTSADTGNYTLIASNSLGVLTSVVARVDVGVTIVNSSFEADDFPVYPGYITANVPITGWTASLPVQTGINPSGGSTPSPFANTGTIPDGAKVAFIQADGGILSQVITGMVPGNTYYLVYFENARAGYNAPTLTVTLGGETIVPAHAVTPGEYVQVVSGPFLATADSAELAFLKSPGPAGGDTALILDAVVVLELPPTAPAFLSLSPGTYIKEGEVLTLSAMAQGTMPISYYWQLNGTDLPDATGPMLTLNNILMSQAGNYTVIASNQYGMTTSSIVSIRVGQAITELFNTGIDATGALVPGGSVDPHYQLISSPDPAYPGPQSFVLYDIWPVTNGVYMTNTEISKWIGPRTINSSADGNLIGNYVYRTAFVLESLDPTTAEIRGKWAMDNNGIDILLNGVSLGISNNTMFSTWGEFKITNGFIAGSNTLDLVISNALSTPPGPTAMRVELYGVAEPLPPGPPQIVADPSSLTAIELQDVNINVLAIGSGPLQYQWYYEGFDLPGANGRILPFTRVSTDQAGSYWVVVSNDFGAVTSQVATLTVRVPAQILTQPVDQSVAPGTPVSFLVEAIGDEPLSYQWYFGTEPLQDQTGPELVIPSAQMTDAGTYYVVVSNEFATVVSSNAVLSILNENPVAGTLTLVTRTNQPVTVPIADLLAVCSDPDQDTVLLDSVANAASGAVVFIVDQDIVYTPLPDFVGLDEFSYTISDGKGGTATGTVTVEVYPGNFARMHITDARFVTEGFQVIFAGMPTRTYGIERALVITGPWTNIANVVAAPTGLTPYIDNTSPPTNAFYRITYP